VPEVQEESILADGGGGRGQSYPSTMIFVSMATMARYFPTMPVAIWLLLTLTYATQYVMEKSVKTVGKITREYLSILLEQRMLGFMGGDPGATTGAGFG